MFTDLCFQIINRASNLLNDGALECHIFDNVHFYAYFFFLSLIADKASAGSREEALWVFAE